VIAAPDGDIAAEARAEHGLFLLTTVETIPGSHTVSRGLCCIKGPMLYQGAHAVSRGSCCINGLATCKGIR
jgi:hypothetical protein